MRKRPWRPDSARLALDEKRALARLRLKRLRSRNGNRNLLAALATPDLPLVGLLDFGQIDEPEPEEIEPEPESGEAELDSAEMMTVPPSSPPEPPPIRHTPTKTESAPYPAALMGLVGTGFVVLLFIQPVLAVTLGLIAGFCVIVAMQR